MAAPSRPFQPDWTRSRQPGHWKEKNAPLDQDIFQRLETIANGRSDFLRKLIDRYEDEGRKHLKNLSGWIQHGDRDALKLTAHAFKGASAQMGARVVRSICQQLEEIVESGHLDDAHGLVAGLGNELAAFVAAYRARLL